jgi:transcription elongation GreA/GreB family factor
MARPTTGSTQGRASAPDKAVLHAELIAQLTDALAAAQRAHAAAVEGATHTEARAENPKDTRGLEQSYLARGQAQRVAELEAGLAAVTVLALRRFGSTDPIALGALVTIDADGDGKDADGDTTRTLLFAPHGGGSVLAGEVQVVTPSSPLGRALLGRRVDDQVELRLPGGTLTVVAIV